jgi:hypothetical protein
MPWSQLHPMMAREGSAPTSIWLLRSAASDHAKNRHFGFAGEYSGNLKFVKEPDHVLL